MKQIKAGDKVKNIGGASFSNGEFVCTVHYLEKMKYWTRVWLQETKTYCNLEELELAGENKMEFPYRVGDKIKIIKKPEMWSSHLCDNYPLKKVKIGDIIMIKKFGLDKCSHWQFSGEVNEVEYGFDYTSSKHCYEKVSTEIKENNKQFEIGDRVKERIVFCGQIAWNGTIVGGPYYDVKFSDGGVMKVNYLSLKKIEKPKYDKETIEALAGSIKKWEDIILGKIEDNGSRNCPLCEKFYSEDCNGCPVKEKTNKTLCSDSPYQDWGGNKKVNSENIYLAYKELEFLRNLYKEIK